MKTKFRNLTKKETDLALIKIIDTLLDSSVPYSGKHRQKQWLEGWQQNVKENNLNPHYFGKFKINRLNGNFVEALDKNYEREQLYSILDSVVKKYLNEVENIYEFGCGTGHNLMRLSKINGRANLYGLDWVESSIRCLRSVGIPGYIFDFFKPNQKLRLKPNSGVLTVAALEQTGDNFKKFVSYLLKNKPKICVHIEPIVELLDKNNLMDYLSIKYCEKRKYLSGFLTYLKELEKNGLIQIHEAKRNKIGSLYLEGYSVVAWSPK